MPIYAYRCEACGFAKDVLQKISDDTLTVCPTCEQDAFRKQVTAAGFQLKGSGWYVTDFRNGNGGGAKTAPAAEGGKDGKGDGAQSGGDGAAAPAAAATPAASTTPAATPSSPAAAPASKPAA